MKKANGQSSSSAYFILYFSLRVLTLGFTFRFEGAKRITLVKMRSFY